VVSARRPLMYTLVVLTCIGVIMGRKEGRRGKKNC
jgi:hypothetical protein